MTELLSCPFCGFLPDIDNDDCIYPACRAEYDKESDTIKYRVYNLVCYETGGGCGASVLGETRSDCINKWNNRVA